MSLIKEHNNKIICLLENSKKQNTLFISNLPDEFPVKLPLLDWDSELLLERYLENKSNFLSLVREIMWQFSHRFNSFLNVLQRTYLAGLERKEISSQTNTILRKILADNLASQLSFLGK